MDRLTISSAVPADRAEVLSDRPSVEITESDRIDALDDITWRIQRLGGWNGWTLEALVECEIDATADPDACVRTVKEVLTILGADRLEFDYQRDLYIERLIKRHIPDEQVEAYAYERMDEEGA